MKKHKLFKPKPKNQHGFTFVELLIVIAVIAILAVIGYASYAGIHRKAYDAKVDVTLDKVSSAYSKYVNESGYQMNDILAYSKDYLDKHWELSRGFWKAEDELLWRNENLSEEEYNRERERRQVLYDKLEEIEERYKQEGESASYDELDELNRKYHDEYSKIYKEMYAPTFEKLGITNLDNNFIAFLETLRGPSYYSGLIKKGDKYEANYENSLSKKLSDRGLIEKDFQKNLSGYKGTPMGGILNPEEMESDILTIPCGADYVFFVALSYDGKPLNDFKENDLVDKSGKSCYQSSFVFAYRQSGGDAPGGRGSYITFGLEDTDLGKTTDNPNIKFKRVDVSNANIVPLPGIHNQQSPINPS